LPLEAHELVACSTFHQGRFDRSYEASSAVLASWDEDAYSVLMARIAEHPASSCSSWASLALWALGRSDESLALAERAVVLGEQNQYALSTAVQQRALLHQLRNEPDACIEWADRCRQVGEEQGFAMRTIQADLYKGWALGVSGSPGDGLELITGGLERFRAAGAMLNEAYTLGLLADVVLHNDDPERAVDLIREAFEVSNSRTYFYESELWRLKGCALTSIGSEDAIEQSQLAFDTALETARDQGSPALELRVLIHRIDRSGDHADATAWRHRLAEVLTVYEGQAPTPDTERARAMLES
jgi:tetratricopeptide (TPR) repeat protein